MAISALVGEPADPLVPPGSDVESAAAGAPPRCGAAQARPRTAKLCRAARLFSIATAALCLLLYAASLLLGRLGRGPSGAPAAAAQRAFALLTALPEGWVTYVDSHGQVFYRNQATGRSQWQRPGAEVLQRPEANWVPAYEADQPLPAGWKEMKDDEGRTYYTNSITHESHWQRPEASPLAAAACEYSHFASFAISGNNLELSEGQTAEGCLQLCTAKPSCLAVEFATDRPAGGATVYRPGWCSLQPAGQGQMRAAPGYENLDLYVKGKCLAMPKDPGAGAASAPGAAAHGAAVPPLVAADVPEPTPPKALEAAKSALEAACPPPQVLNRSGDCVQPSGPELMTFYMYRSQSDETYPLENVNMADLAGTLWYLHQEVVASTPRKFDISRVVRYMVTMKNTEKFYRDTSTQFAPFVAFDWGSSRGRSEMWQKWGFVVGCQSIDTSSYNYLPPPGARQYTRAGKWYSLPGRCPEERVGAKSPECMAQWPGGACRSAMVTGANDCTYSTEYAGQIRLDELEGIADYGTWWLGKTVAGGIVPNGNVEYKASLDRGVGMDFWDFRSNETACTRRMEAVARLFKQKYPDLPASLPEPPCDFR